MTESRELTEVEAGELARRDLCATCRAVSGERGGAADEFTPPP